MDDDRRQDHDAVAAPEYYTGVVPGVECVDVAQHLGFNRENAVKYLWRAGSKDEQAEGQDLNKAIQYLMLELERLGQPLTAKMRGER